MVVKEGDENLALFLEMPIHEQQGIEGNGTHLLPSSDKVDAPLGFNPLSSPMSKTLSMDRKMGVEELLNLGNDKNDLLWLLSPPGTPLLTSLKTEGHDRLTSLILNEPTRPTALTSSVENVQLDSAFKKPTESKDSSLPHESKFSATNRKKSSSSASHSLTTGRAATPTGRSTVPAANKPVRSSTPSRVSTRPSSAKPVGPTATRSSVPTQFTKRSSTPTAHSSSPALKSTSKQSVPITRSSTQSNTSCKGAPNGQARSSSAIKSRVTSRTDMPPNGTPTSDPRPCKPSNRPSPSTDSKSPKTSLPTKTSLPRRPLSASRARPSLSIDKSFPPIKSRRYSNEDDEVNPVLMGTQMVERLVNQRKLGPPKRDAQQPGFGRSLSSKSLEMAMRHMDIRGNISSCKPIKTRPGPAKSNKTTAAESLLAMSSNTSSDVISVNTSMDGSESEDNDLGAAKVTPITVQGR